MSEAGEPRGVAATPRPPRLDACRAAAADPRRPPGWRIKFVPGPRPAAPRQRSAAHPARAGHARKLKVSVDAAWRSAARRSRPGSLPPALEPRSVRATSIAPPCDAVFEWAEGECELRIERSRRRARRPPLAHRAPRRADAATCTAAQSRRQPPAAGRPRPRRAAAGPDGGSIRVSIEKIDELLNSVGELVITQSVLSQLAAPLEGREAERVAQRARRSSSVTCARCRKASCACACCPSASCSTASRAWCATWASGSARRSNCKSPATATELDKTVLEKIGDPLVHLVRNSIDHGIEIARSARSPPARATHGTIELHAYHKGGNVIVEVSDDGGGLQQATRSSRRRASAASSRPTRSCPRSASST